MRGPQVITAGLAAVAASAVVVGCASGDLTGGSSGSSSGAAGSQLGVSAPAAGLVTVLAAASLRQTFTTLAKRFETMHPGVHVRLSFGASSTLAQQLKQGLPADVFASASTTNMKQVADAGAVSSSTSFARNTMRIAVPPGNPARIGGLSDLARGGVKLALCQPQVPCGATAAKVFENARITVKPVTLEADVSSTLTKVELNEVDAAVVYVTDVRAAGARVKGIDIPSDLNASTEYPIATLNRAPYPAGAKAFVDYVLSADGASVLAAAGFGQP